MSYDGSGTQDNASPPGLPPTPPGLPPFNLVNPITTMPPGSDAVLSAAASFIHDNEVTDAVTDALGVLRERHRTIFLARALVLMQMEILLTVLMCLPRKTVPRSPLMFIKK
jgi:hypothetical protein